MEFINFVLDPTNDYMGHLIDYLKLCGVAIAVATIIGVGLGILVSRSAFLAFIAINLSGVMRAIPIIAALFIIFSIVKQLGFLPAIIALILLGIPPVLINTYTGIRGIDPAAIEAAKGMGMTSWQIATRIQAPLVTPLVAAGIRTSAVQIVATATLAAFVGAGGFGDYIVDGLTVFNNTELIVGAVSVAALAMIIEVSLSWLQRALTSEGLKVQEQAISAKA
ncbi:MAG TPA: ABC transporter permease [Ktedonobacteraceae bacterium]|jgi:osmoprotectant transport system permease protein|nr:ABC transporter permease [Ktedonobacteraceae bacterium]